MNKWRNVKRDQFHYSWFIVLTLITTMMKRSHIHIMLWNDNQHVNINKIKKERFLFAKWKIECRHELKENNLCLISTDSSSYTEHQNLLKLYYSMLCTSEKTKVCLSLKGENAAKLQKVVFQNSQKLFHLPGSATRRAVHHTQKPV